MTLADAMQINRQILDGKELPSIADRNAAIALGFEALKTMKAERLIYGFKRQVRLPGETDQ